MRSASLRASSAGCHYFFATVLNPRDSPSSYGLERYGPSYRFRLWLRLDALELESIEMLINHGSDANIEAFRASHLAIAGTTSVVVRVHLAPRLW